MTYIEQFFKTDADLLFLQVVTSRAQNIQHDRFHTAAVLIPAATGAVPALAILILSHHSTM